MMNAAEYKAVQINKIIKSSPEYHDYRELKNEISAKYSSLNVESLAKAECQDETIKKDPLITRFIEATNKLQAMVSNIKSLIEIGV